MKWDSRTKRNVAIVVFGLLGAANTPGIERLLTGIFAYEIYGGLLISHLFGALALMGAWMLYKKHF